MKKMIFYTATEKNSAIFAVESGTAFVNIDNVVIFATHKEAVKYAEKRDGKNAPNKIGWL